MRGGTLATHLDAAESCNLAFHVSVYAYVILLHSLARYGTMSRQYADISKLMPRLPRNHDP